MGLTQPAVSNTLAKLRRQFGDDLFVRTPGGHDADAVRGTARRAPSARPSA